MYILSIHHGDDRNDSGGFILIAIISWWSSFWRPRVASKKENIQKSCEIKTKTP
jgi:hypothetical protein